MRLDARNVLDETPAFEVILNGIPLENVVAVDTKERWIVRRLSIEEIVRAENRGEVFLNGTPPEETVYVNRTSRLEIRVFPKYAA